MSNGCCFMDVALRSCSRQHIAFLNSSYLAFSLRFFDVPGVNQYSSTDSHSLEKILSFILTERSNFHMIDNLLIAVYDFATCMSTPISVDEILLSRYVNESTTLEA